MKLKKLDFEPSVKYHGAENIGSGIVGVGVEFNAPPDTI